MGAGKGGQKKKGREGGKKGVLYEGGEGKGKFLFKKGGIR